MIQLNLKRKIGNESVVFGVLSIPEYNFKCVTMELADKGDLLYKFNCALPYGVYELKPGYCNGDPMFPILKKKPVGFSVRPKFNLGVSRYDHLPTGDIALGTAHDGEFAVRISRELNETFVRIFKEVFLENPNEIVVLNIFRSKNFVYNEISYEEMLEREANKVFLEEEDDDDSEEPVELEDDIEQG